MTKQFEHSVESEISQVTLDQQLTIDCMVGAISAYNDFAKKPWTNPPDFEYITRFYGWDRYFVTNGAIERFGLIFQLKNDPSTWLVAFRGTSSNLDAYEDLWANTVNFKPYEPTRTVPKDIEVACGFNSVYTEKGGGMADSMQGQLFSALKIGKPKTVFVTGHSLGGALASLFTLDVAACLPDTRVINTTFASPRVGKSVWQSTYDKKLDLLGATFRVANYEDYVPSLPPSTLLGYRHVGESFLVNFKVKGAWVPHPVCRHSMKNYQVVVGNAVQRNPQVWYGEFPDKSTTPPDGWTMISSPVPSSEVPEWAELFQDFEKRASARP